MSFPQAKATSPQPSRLCRTYEKLGALLARPLSWARPIVPRSLLLGFDEFVFDLRVLGLPDRIYLEQYLLPAFANLGERRVLFVGTAWFTERYAKIFEQPGNCYSTLDRSSRAKGGASDRHYIADLRDIAVLFQPGAFNLVIVNGVFGFGLDKPEDILAALKAVHRVLCPGGHLLLGWNQDRTADPLTSECLLDGYKPANIGDLPPRKLVKSFGKHIHVFDLLEAKASECKYEV